MKKWKLILPAGAAVVCAGLLLGAFFQPSGKTQGSYKALTLSPTLLQNTISTTGTVESVDRTLVYASLNYQVAEQNVEVGDRVEAGDVLCRLDSAALERQIAQQEASLSTSARNARQQIESAQKNYDNYSQSLADGTDSSLLNAQNQVTTAKNSLAQAQLKLDSLEADQSSEYAVYKDARDHYTDCRSALKNAEKALSSAKQALSAAQAAGASEAELAGLQAAVQTAENARSAAQSRLDIAQSSYEGARALYKSIAVAYDQAELAVSSAQSSYDAAVQSLRSAQTASGQKLDSYADSLKNAEANAQNETGYVTLKGLEDQLADTVVTAPVSGTVTAVYAKRGAPASGLLYVIEDTERLQVATSVKEYDITQVKTGMKAVVTSDATGDEEFSGTLVQIAPTAQKAADGSTLSGTNVEFDATVAVDRENTPLRVGMNARVELVLEEKENVFAVPYDAIVEAEGRPVVYVAQPAEKGGYTARAVAVTTGMETDFYIEIQGEGLAEGTLLISNPDGLADGDKVELGKAAA